MGDKQLTLTLLVLEVDLPPQLVLLVAELGGDGRMGLPSSSACRMRRFFSNSARSVPSKAARPGPRHGVDEGLAGSGRTGAACARPRGVAEARGGEVDEGAPGAGARSTRGRRGPGRSGGGGRRSTGTGVRLGFGGDRGARGVASRWLPGFLASRIHGLG